MPRPIVVLGPPLSLPRRGETIAMTNRSASMNPDGVAIYIREDGETLPLMIRPIEENNSPEFLRNWIVKNKQWLDGKLLEHGTRTHLIKINAFIVWL